MTWKKGDLIKDGKYKIESEINEGGYGTIYLASCNSGKDFVAIKVIKDELKICRGDKKS